MMILSKNKTQGEYDAIRKPAHIQAVWSAIEAALPKYWNSFVAEKAVTPASKLASHFGGAQPATSASGVMLAFAKAVQDYEKAALKYRDFFDLEAIDEFRQDPGTFKTHMAREVPVISGTLNQRRPELQDWQRDFRAAKPRDLFAVFSNILDFREEWAATKPEVKFAKFDTVEEFALDPLDVEENMTLSNVIGMGIKSIVLYHLDPRLLPQRGRFDLYGLYFLSGMKDFGLASESSEFLMINDREMASNGSFIMEHNFWYPYGLYSLYAMRIFRWLDARVQNLGGALDPVVRYVYVSYFLSSVCEKHGEDMRVMRAHDRFGNPA